MINEARELLDKIYHNPRLGVNLALGNGCERIAYKLTEDLVVKISKEAMFNEEILDIQTETDVEIRKYSRALWDFCLEDQTETELFIHSRLTDEQKKLFNPILFNDVYNGHMFTIAPKGH